MNDNFNDFLENQKEKRENDANRAEIRKEQHIEQINLMYNLVTEWLKESIDKGNVSIQYDFKFVKEPFTFNELIIEFEGKRVTLSPRPKYYENESLTFIDILGENVQREEISFSYQNEKWVHERQGEFGNWDEVNEEYFHNILKKYFNI